MILHDPVPRNDRIVGAYITETVAREILERQGYACAACGTAVTADGAHFDHIVPVILGGQHTARNMHALCLLCHHRMMLLQRDWFARRSDEEPKA
ncbi:hypothetical protein ABH15_04590 [Methanoculleus taiwanensis]|uniref:HNH nuclease domain-containing protein n=1 Tax=Methanoculleus taiwanensis TaxID=1550565 RepID=A0A498H6P4_9EURY|nr:HNH endonuclease [Methanoculleus taiwanensis]RXE57488.1 hypothetical protein ABH15_04590 [Methanoculleus taiwanensis]